MSRVIIGMDPHKRSVTIEAIDRDENVLTKARFATDRVGFRDLLVAGRRHPERVWAVEAARVLDATLRSDWCRPASRWSTCQRSCRRRLEGS